MNNVEKEILQLIGKALEAPAATLNIRSGLGRHPNWDSLGHVSIMVLLEQRYLIEIGDTEIERILTVRDITEFIKKKLINSYQSS